MKDSHWYLDEWIQYHLNIGFDNIFIVEDIGSKPHNEITDKYPQVTLMKFSDYLVPMENQEGIQRQIRIYNKFLFEHKEGWCAFIDDDEFVELQNGFTLNDIAYKYFDLPSVFMCWKIHGANGHIIHVNNVYQSYTEISPYEPHSRWQFKAFVNLSSPNRFKCVHLLDIDNMMNYSKQEYIDYINEKGFQNYIHLNHYLTKSWEDWMWKVCKRGNPTKGLRKLDDFFKRNPNMAFAQNLLMAEQDYDKVNFADLQTKFDNLRLQMNKDKTIIFNYFFNFCKINRLTLFSSYNNTLMMKLKDYNKLINIKHKIDKKYTLKNQFINNFDCITFSLADNSNYIIYVYPLNEIDNADNYLLCCNFLSTSNNNWQEYCLSKKDDLLKKFPDTNLDNPQLFADKVQWLKIYDSTPLKAYCADKITVRNYCKDKLGIDLCIPLIKTYDKPEEIEWNELPDKFVIKCNHGSRMNIIVKDKNNINKSEINNKLNKWLNTKFGDMLYELHYNLIEPKILIEQYMEDSNGCLLDYKFLCFNGNIQHIRVTNNANTNQVYNNFYDTDFNPMENIRRLDHPSDYSKLDKKPKNFELMKEYAETLSKDFKLVRVDFYEVNEKVYLGELTFTPAGGKFKFDNDEINLLYGNNLKLN